MHGLEPKDSGKLMKKGIVSSLNLEELTPKTGPDGSFIQEQ